VKFSGFCSILLEKIPLATFPVDETTCDFCQWLSVRDQACDNESLTV